MIRTNYNLINIYNEDDNTLKTYIVIDGIKKEIKLDESLQRSIDDFIEKCDLMEYYQFNKDFQKQIEFFSRSEVNLELKDFLFSLNLYNKITNKSNICETRVYNNIDEFRLVANNIRLFYNVEIDLNKQITVRGLFND